VQARAVLKKELGVWAGDVAEDPSERARVRARWSTAGAGKAELTGGPTAQRERDSGREGAIARCLVKRAHETEREEGHEGEGNWRR
jgi:hypothetical protein